MAGSSVTVTTAPSKYLVGFGGRNEIVVSLACVSDDAAGTVPSETLDSTDGLAGLVAYQLQEVITVPDSVAPPTTAYRVKIVDSVTGEKLFIGTARAVGASAISETQGGYEHLGFYPPIDNAPTITLIQDDGATEAAADVGNSKELTIKLRFVKREF